MVPFGRAWSVTVAPAPRPCVSVVIVRPAPPPLWYSGLLLWFLWAGAGPLGWVCLFPGPGPSAGVASAGVVARVASLRGAGLRPAPRGAGLRPAECEQLVGLSSLPICLFEFTGKECTCQELRSCGTARDSLPLHWEHVGDPSPRASIDRAHTLSRYQHFIQDSFGQE